MDKILFLDTSVGSLNKGDDIIMECVDKELEFVTQGKFKVTLPTHVSSFNWFQCWRKSIYVQQFANSKFKFVGGTNLLVKNMFTHLPQWNLNWFNSRPLEGAIMVGVGAGAGDKTNWYTRKLYNKVLSHDFYHSVRDERSKLFIESLGLKAINTGCVTMWMLTPEFCKKIPTGKADKVVFTLTSYSNDSRDQYIIDTLLKNYNEVYYWPQDDHDFDYLHRFNNIERIKILESTKEAYDKFLTENDTDYVGTRLHGGVYAMRHCRRAIIIAIDERAREINKHNNLNCIDKENLLELEDMINSEFTTEIMMDFDKINHWKNQFK